MKQTTRRNRQRQNTTRRQRQRKNNKRVKGGASFSLTFDNHDIRTLDLELFLTRVLEEPNLIQSHQHGIMILEPYEDFLEESKYKILTTKLYIKFNPV
tara:strand:+ start:205 stop:498 length:294 start_codon:yes stop_codon:yes gene_type:complete